MLSGGTPGMPLNPPSAALPIAYSLPDVEFTSWNRMIDTVSVMTPM